MQITFATDNGDVFSLDLQSNIQVKELKDFVAAESRIQPSEMSLLFDGSLLKDELTLERSGIREGDMIFIQRKTNSQASTPLIDFSRVRAPNAQSSRQQTASSSSGHTPDPYVLREMLLGSPHELALLKQNNPPLSDALLSGNPDRFAEVFNQQMEEKRKVEQEQMALLLGDPFDPEVQRRIAENIQRENVNANMEAAMEFAPESFGQVHMLYIDCLVNGHHVKAFVDSGAQMTIMSKACADRCHISHLIDTRWAGIAKGVGVQRILGRIHMCHIVIKHDHLQCSFSILEDQPMDMLLGLDMLKRHQCCLDLKRNVLVIGTTGTETEFLSEAELPDYARLNRSISQLEQERDIAEALLQSQREVLESSHNSADKSTTSGASSKPSQVSASGLSTSTTSIKFPEASINKLVSSGFTRDQAIAELTKTGGNVDTALINLLARSIAMPKK